MSKLCIYHKDCTDGFGAALAVWMAHGEGVGIDFLAADYQDNPPTVAGRDVIIVDFSYKRDVLLDMAAEAKSILVLDHHESAKRQLVDLPDNVEVHFDMERSGAVIAWEYYHEGRVPELLRHIQARDLWHQDALSEKVVAALRCVPRHFQSWADRLQGSGLHELAVAGQWLVTRQTQDIHEHLAVAAFQGRIAGVEAPVANVPRIWASEAGAILSGAEFSGTSVEKFSPPFSATFWQDDARRHYSLRSTPGGLNVALIAEHFGGGGHARAAGFSVPLDKVHLVANRPIPGTTETSN